MQRAHGMRGEVVVHLVTDRTDRLAPGARLVLGTGGEVEVRASRPHGRHFVVSLAGVTTRTEAEALAGCPLRAAPVHDPEALWVHELVGAEVVEEGGPVRGVVVAVQANPASDLLVLDTGALVPVRFVTGHEPGARVVVDVPAGLFDL